MDTFKAMWRGDLLIPPADTFASIGLKLERRDAGMFELGFDINSLRDMKVQGVVVGSNVERAGVREGDTITWSAMAWGVADSLDKMMELVVDRDGEAKTLRYWPRTTARVECYKWVKIDSE